MRAGLAPLLLISGGLAQAQSFHSMDPRALGMGGVGVASGNSATAGFTNPALLSLPYEGDRFSVAAPIVGARFRDPDALLPELENYQNNGLEADLTAAVEGFIAIEAYRVAISDGVPALNGVRNEAANVAAAARALQAQLEKFAGRPMQGERLGGVAVGAPVGTAAKNYGVALTFSRYAVMGGELNYADQTLLQSLIDAADTTVNADTQAELDALENISAIDAQIQDSANTVDSLASSLVAKGAVISELGLSLSRRFSLAGHDVAVGVTPKAVKVKAFHYVTGVAEADIDAEYGAKEYSDINLDVGVAKGFGNGWKTALVVKNVVAQEYETAPLVATQLAALGVTEASTRIKIDPQARVGVSYHSGGLTLATDLDVTENEPAGFDSDTQYLGLGAEVALFDWGWLRAGYRHNLSDSDTSISSLGFGFAPFGVYMDVAIAGNGDEVAGAFQAGVRF